MIRGLLQTGIINLLLRGTTLISKFLLMVLMARLLAPELVGVYGLVAVTIVISLFVLGMDFYAFNTRELLQSDEKYWPSLIRDQFAFHGVMYVLVLPLLASVFLLGFLSWQYAPWFFLLVVLEHLSQESFRLLVTMGRSSMANGVLFIRSGSWIVALALLWWMIPDSQHLMSIWIAWATGAALSVAVAAFAVRQLPWRLVRSQAIRWDWIRHGTKVALPLLMATLALQGVQYADRYLISHFCGDELLGVYSFFGSIANVMHVFVFSAVTMVLHPQAVKAYRLGDLANYGKSMQLMTWATLGGLIPLGSVLAFGIGPVLSLVNREVYFEHINAFYILLAAFAVLVCSHIPHYALYARKCDKAILASSLAALVLSLLAGYVLIPSYGIVGGAWATFVASCVLCLMKVILLTYLAHKPAVLAAPVAVPIVTAESVRTR